MLVLLLLRHAKTSKTDTGRQDIDRPLTKRGKRDADAMGRYMQANGLLPDVVLCSPSRRTRSTWDLVANRLKSNPKILFTNGIYASRDGEELKDAIRRQGGEAKSLLLVGHNPSMEQLARQLAQKGEKKGRSRLEVKFPTAALAVLSLNTDNWKTMSEDASKLVRFVRPADILIET